MKKSHLLLILVAAVLVAGLLVGRLTAPSHSDAPVAVETATASEYTCSMHPQIRQPNPGKCPICAMELIPAGKADSADRGEREITLTPYARALAKIATSPVTREFPDAEIRLYGRVQADESRERSISARFPARIDQLYVNYTGITVKKDDHLAMVYSPELLTAQAELLAALRFNDARAIRSARDKLSLWGFSATAIAGIETSGEPRDNIDIDAPLGGIVTEKMINEGDYVQTGDPMFRIADLSTVWIVLDAYEMDMPWIRFGQEVSFTAKALPGREFTGKIAFVPPVIDSQSRTFKVRVNLENEDQLLRPGMFVNGVVRATLAAEGVVLDADLAGKWISPMHPEIVKDGPGECDICGMDLVPAESLGYVAGDAGPPLVIPASAALRTGKRAIVYVEDTNAEVPTYHGREIELGPRAGDVYLITAGLEEGERVVTNGAFKLDSALQILGKPSMMSEAEQGTEDEGRGEIVEIQSKSLAGVTETYLQLQKALADDDLEASKAALLAMMEVTGHTGPLPDLLHLMLEATDLAALRLPHFETLSNSLIAAVREHAGLLETPLLVMHCPMVHGDTGADWLQSAEPLRNPYFGASMLLCGEVKEEVGRGETGRGTEDGGRGEEADDHGHLLENE